MLESNVRRERNPVGVVWGRGALSADPDGRGPGRLRGGRGCWPASRCAACAGLLGCRHGAPERAARRKRATRGLPLFLPHSWPRGSRTWSTSAVISGYVSLDTCLQVLVPPATGSQTTPQDRPGSQVETGSRRGERNVRVSNSGRWACGPGAANVVQGSARRRTSGEKKANVRRRILPTAARLAGTVWEFPPKSREHSAAVPAARSSEPRVRRGSCRTTARTDSFRNTAWRGATGFARTPNGELRKGGRTW